MDYNAEVRETTTTHVPTSWGSRLFFVEKASVVFKIGLVKDLNVEDSEWESTFAKLTNGAILGAKNEFSRRYTLSKIPQNAFF